jgi:hypothetical protein
MLFADFLQTANLHIFRLVGKALACRWFLALAKNIVEKGLSSDF